jgi:hypothetical protein
LSFSLASGPDCGYSTLVKVERDAFRGQDEEVWCCAESRRWKESLAEETEGMTPEETIAYFDRSTVRRGFEAASQQAEKVKKARARVWA